MIVKSTLNIGSSSFEFQADEKDPKDSMLIAIALATPREYCNVCKTGGLDTKSLSARKAKTDDGEFTYISVRCKCGATSTLGSYKTGGFFWKEYELFQKDKETTPNRSDRDLSMEDYTA